MRGPGALSYEPASVRSEDTLDIDLDGLAQDAADLLAGREIKHIEQLSVLGAASGGARPKLLVELLPSGTIR